MTGITRSERVIMGREFLSEFLMCGTGIPGGALELKAVGPFRLLSPVDCELK